MKSYDQSQNHITKLRDYWKRPEWSKLIFRSNLQRSEQEHKNWLPKYRCFTTGGLERTGENGVQTNKVWRKWFQIILRRTDAAHEEPYISLLRPRGKSLGRNWCWERLSAGEEGNDRGWDGWKASLTQRSWVWIKLWEIWMAGEPWVLAVHEVTRVWQVWVTEQHQK